MTTKRRKYTTDFKREAVQLWQTSGRTAAEIEQELGISAGLLGRWKRKLRQGGSTAFEPNTTLSAEQKRIRQLERELRIAKMERDILKKAVAIPSASSGQASRPQTNEIRVYRGSSR